MSVGHHAAAWLPCRAAACCKCVPKSIFDFAAAACATLSRSLFKTLLQSIRHKYCTGQACGQQVSMPCTA